MHDERYATQRVTAADLKSGRIRVPSREASLTRTLFPADKRPLNIKLRGRLVQASWDPRVESDHQRSGVLHIGTKLQELVAEGEVLVVSVGHDNIIAID